MQALSKAKVKFFQSLSIKKYRNEEKMFIIEGIKMFQEAIHADWKMAAIIVLEEQSDKIMPILAQFPTLSNFPFFYLASKSDFQALSSLNSPEGILTILHFPEEKNLGITFPQLPENVLLNGPGFILENVQDPGNVGTILRIADWFGMKEVICTEGTADILNSKTLRSSMGAIFRINVTYVKDIYPSLEAHKNRIWVAEMGGENLKTLTFDKKDFVLMGNEANGISDKVKAIAGMKYVSIQGNGEAESLNVGVAAGILGFHLAR